MTSPKEVVMQEGVAVVDLPEEVTLDSKPLWESYVVGHFIDDAPHIGKVCATVNRLWTTKEKPSMIDAQFIAPKTALFRIEDQQMKNRVLRRHFWHIADVPLVVQEWTPDTESTKPDLTATPLCVDLKGVPGHLFSHVGLTLFGDTIGKTAKLHPNTVRCTRLDVARLLVVMNLENPLPEKCGKTKETNADFRQGKKKSQKAKQSEIVDGTASKTQESTDDHDGVNLVLSEEKSAGSKADPPAVNVISQSKNETEWKLVGNGQKSSPRRETAPINSEKVTHMGSPSRFNLLSDVEDGEVEASSSKKEETEEPVVAQKAETYPQKSPDKTKKKKRNKVGLDPRSQSVDHPDFATIVAESWNSAEPLYHLRSAIFLFHRKLKQLKPAIRLLNKTRFGDVPFRAKEAFKNLCDMQEQAL
ncbi:hypothetical protein Bca4012_065322 [Brassica carinata]